MDRDRYSFLAHASHDYCSPVDAAFMEPVYDRVPLTDGMRVLDAGCGKSEVLLRFVERGRDAGVRVSGVGVDASRLCVQESRERARKRVPDAELEFACVPVVRWPRTDSSFDVVVVLGATHAFGRPSDAVREARKVLRPGGFLLVGEACWRKSMPDAEYTAALGVKPKDALAAGELATVVSSGGFEVVVSKESSVEDFDRYESAYARNIEDFVATHPADPEAAWMLERARKWAALHQRLGRDNMGFGVVLGRAV